VNIEIQQWLNAPKDWRHSINGFRAGTVLYHVWGDLNSWKGVFAKNIKNPSALVMDKMEILLEEIYELSKHTPERKAVVSSPKIELKKKNPNHYWNGTMNVYLPNGEQVKIHKRLIEKCNGLAVRFGKASIGSMAYADLLKLLNSGDWVDLVWCKFSSRYKSGGERVCFKVRARQRDVPPSVNFGFDPPEHLKDDFELLKSQGDAWFIKMADLLGDLQRENIMERRYLIAKQLKECEEKYLWINDLKHKAIDIGALPEEFLNDKYNGVN
jgi:hypothetical protein